jgi:ABC-2 type transport system permease protein
MATSSTLDRNTVLAAREGLVPAQSRSRLGGFGNMLGKELGDWFATRQWLVQTIIWLVIINGLMAFIMFGVPSIDPEAQVPLDERMVQGLTLFFSFSVMFGAIGMIIIAQDEIIQEKQTGTAAWILSKPVACSSFVLTKLLSNLVGGLIFIVALPAAVAYAQIYLDAEQAPSVLPYLAAVGVVLLTLTFYLSLVIMLGTLYEERGPVLGIAVGLYLGGMIASQFTNAVTYFLPVKMQDIAAVVAQGEALPAAAVSELITAAAWSVLFILVALWRFGREEL